MSSVVIWSCGGCGTNIVKNLTDLDLCKVFVDTSDSNLKGVSHDEIFLLDNTKGAGKDRSITYEHFKDVASDVIIKHKPGTDLNIVISSLSGGSGSVIAPLITKELIKNNYNTVVIGIDSKTSHKEIDNTIKTLQSYKSVSNGVKKSISLFYIENSNRKNTDDKASWFINLLTLLVSKYNTEEFDNTDLSNFINFERVTENEPTVSVIELNNNEEVIPDKNTNIVSTILVTTNKEATIRKAIPEYLATCLVIDETYNNEDIRIDNVVGKLTNIVMELEAESKELQDSKRVNKIKDLVVTNSNSDDLVI